MRDQMKEMHSVVERYKLRAQEAKAKVQSTELHIAKLEANIHRLELDLDAYKQFLNGTYENLIVDDKDMRKKAAEIKKRGFNMRKDDLLRQEIEQLEKSVKNANVF